MYYLLNDLGRNTDSVKNISDAIEFYHTVMYSGNKEDSIKLTRSKMYERLKEKSSQSIIADMQSLEQHIKRADLQCYVWKQCYQQIISDVSPVGRGWKIVGKLLNPVWFDGFQLPPILRKSIDYQADSESEVIGNTKKRRKRQRKSARSLKRSMKDDEEYRAYHRISSHSSSTTNDDENKGNSCFGSVSDAGSDQSDEYSDMLRHSSSDCSENDDDIEL